MLHVYFKETDRDSEHRLVRILLDVVKDVLYSSRHDTDLILDSTRHLFLTEPV